MWLLIQAIAAHAVLSVLPESATMVPANHANHRFRIAVVLAASIHRLIVIIAAAAASYAPAAKYARVVHVYVLLGKHFAMVNVLHVLQVRQLVVIFA
jgi:hypothetical protein